MSKGGRASCIIPDLSLCWHGRRRRPRLASGSPRAHPPPVVCVGSALSPAPRPAGIRPAVNCKGYQNPNPRDSIFVSRAARMASGRSLLGVCLVNSTICGDGTSSLSRLSRPLLDFFNWSSAAPDLIIHISNRRCVTMVLLVTPSGRLVCCKPSWANTDGAVSRL